MNEQQPPVCPLPVPADLGALEQVDVHPDETLPDYLRAMKLADGIAGERLGDYMLISWYDRDRDFESPQHSSECHQDSAVPGYVDYALSHGATLKVDFEDGRFVFFYMPVEL